MIEHLVANYKSRIPISLVVGGLQPGTTIPISDDSRKEILHHWQQVNKMTGAEFNFDNALPEGFIYDTEPPCRAAVTIPQLDPQATLTRAVHGAHPTGAQSASGFGSNKTMPYFIRLQQAFYAEQRDITKPEVLADIAAEFGIDRQTFLDQWSSPQMQDKAQQNFQMTRQFGVRGFPTLIAQDKESLELVCSGYMSVAQIEPKLLAWLEQSEKGAEQA